MYLQCIWIHLANVCVTVLCHINLNLEYAKLHNDTAGNNNDLHIVAFLLRYCILNTVLIIYSCMLSTQCQLLTSTQTYMTRLTFCI